MIKFSSSIFALIFLISLANAASNSDIATADNGSTCTCKEISKSYLATQLWKITSPSWSALQVLQVLRKEFAPTIVQMPGFETYTGAETDEDNTLFLMKHFTSPEETALANSEAESFVSQHEVLKDVIEPYYFTKADMSFHFTSRECVKQTVAGKYLITRLWQLTDNSNITIQDVADEFERGYAPIIHKYANFLEYGGAPVPGTDYIFFYNVFTDRRSAIAANNGAATFVREGMLNGQIQKVKFTEGLVDFDFTCVTGYTDEVSAASLVSIASFMTLIAGAISSAFIML